MCWFNKKSVNKNFNPECYEVTASKLRTMLPRYIADYGNYFLYNKKYRIPFDPKYIMKSIPSYEYKYIKEKRDCENFVFIFRGILSSLGYGDLIGMEANLDMLIDGKIEPHACIAFIDINGELDENGKYTLVFGEPQTGKLINKDISKDFKNIKLRI